MTFNPDYKTIINLIGNTPLVKLTNGHNPRVELFLKLEAQNPSGSIKDVAALFMIKDAEDKGLLKPGAAIIEATSGNTGISFAMIGAVKGYKVKLVLPDNVSAERLKILKALGAELVLTPGSEGVDAAIIKARELVKADSSLVYLNQYDNPANSLGHYYLTGNEAWRQTKGRITHFIAGMGTGGTLMGAGRRLKELKPSVKIIGVEPVKGHSIQGLKNMSESIMPKIFDKSLLDEVIIVSDDQAFKAGRWLARTQGVLGGMSTGAAVHAGLKKAKELDSGVIVVISPDSGFKYLSTELFNSDHHA